MIEPARRRLSDREIVDRMVDVCRIDAQRIEGEPDAGCMTHARYNAGRDEQPDRARDFCYPGPQNYLFRIRYPIRGYLKKSARGADMRDSGKQINERQQDAEKAFRPSSRIKPLRPSMAAIICHLVSRPSLL